MSVSQQNGLCEILEWDSQFFGVRIARVIPSSPTRSQLEEIVRWSHQEDVTCTYLLASADDLRVIRDAEDFGFRLVDIRLTMELPLKAANAAIPASVRPATETDIERLRAIAGTVFTLSRFHADAGFDPNKVDEMYRVWVEKSCRGAADAVLVTGPVGAPSGFVVVKRTGEASVRIVLIGVAPDHQHRGLGGILVDAAVGWAATTAARHIFVITQGANIPAQRLYQRKGFRTAAVQLWLHRWQRT